MGISVGVYPELEVRCHSVLRVRVGSPWSLNTDIQRSLAGKLCKHFSVFILREDEISSTKIMGFPVFSLRIFWSNFSTGIENTVVTID